MKKNCDIDLGESAGKGLAATFFWIAIALCCALAFRIFLFEPYWIPSGSMKPTLLVGDLVVVNKMAYGPGHASCPSLAIFEVDSETLCGFLDDGAARRSGKEPKRGDVIVYRDQLSAEVMVKRVIGLPGERIRIVDGTVLINDVALPQIPDGIFKEAFMPQGGRAILPACRNVVDHVLPETICEKDRAIETLPDGRQYGVLDLGAGMVGDNTLTFTVPANRFFVLGDNRDNSLDSRFQGSHDGNYVRATDIIGRADRLILSWAGDAFWKVWTWRKDRFFHRIFPL